jgi:hypothetical protein
MDIPKHVRTDLQKAGLKQDTLNWLNDQLQRLEDMEEQQRYGSYPGYQPRRGQLGFQQPQGFFYPVWPHYDGNYDYDNRRGVDTSGRRRTYNGGDGNESFRGEGGQGAGSGNQGGSQNHFEPLRTVE